MVSDAGQFQTLRMMTSNEKQFYVKEILDQISALYIKILSRTE
jgi:hypothetical protein